MPFVKYGLNTRVQNNSIFGKNIHALISEKGILALVSFKNNHPVFRIQSKYPDTKKMFKSPICVLRVDG